MYQEEFEFQERMAWNILAAKPSVVVLCKGTYIIKMFLLFWPADILAPKEPKVRLTPFASFPPISAVRLLAIPGSNSHFVSPPVAVVCLAA